jgi:hypothetical protein
MSGRRRSAANGNVVNLAETPDSQVRHDNPGLRRVYREVVSPGVG